MIVDGNIVRPVPPSEPIPNPWRTESGYGTAGEAQGGTGFFSLQTHRTCIDRICPGFHTRSLTFLLTLLQVLLFLISWVVSLVTAKSTPFLGVSYCTLYEFGAKWAPSIKYHFEIHRLILPIFLHTSFVHIFVNMISQCSLMFLFEDDAVCGRKRLLAFYILCGIFANAVSCVVSPRSLSAGASGSLFGVFGLQICFLISRGEFEPQRRQVLQLNLAFVIVANMFISLSAPAIDTSAHVGGLIAGLLGGIAVLQPPDTDHFEVHKYARHGAIAFAFLLVLFVLLIWAVEIPQVWICP